MLLSFLRTEAEGHYFIVMAADMTGARIEFYKCFRETTHDLYNMITKKLEEL